MALTVTLAWESDVVAYFTEYMLQDGVRWSQVTTARPPFVLPHRDRQKSI